MGSNWRQNYRESPGVKKQSLIFVTEMKIFVKAKTGAKEDRVIPPPPKLILDSEEWFIVSTKERPVEGRANEAITKLLAEYFRVARSNVRLISGATSKRKIFEIN